MCVCVCMCVCVLHTSIHTHLTELEGMLLLLQRAHMWEYCRKPWHLTDFTFSPRFIPSQLKLLTGYPVHFLCGIYFITPGSFFLLGWLFFNASVKYVFKSVIFLGQIKVMSVKRDMVTILNKEWMNSLVWVYEFFQLYEELSLSLRVKWLLTTPSYSLLWKI